MVKLLPSDIARLVLAYLQGKNLKNVSQKFLEDSPDLDEVRQNPGCPVLPPLAKDLETILEEHATFIQDGKNKSKVNPVIIQLWKKLDTVVAQLKYEYLQEKLPPPQMKGVNNYLTNQRVRSRISLNALRSRQNHGRDQIITDGSSVSASGPRQPSDDRNLQGNSNQNSSESQEDNDDTLTQQATPSSAAPESRKDSHQGLDASQPSTSGTQRDAVRSPKRKGITPKKKYSPEDLIPIRNPPSQQLTTPVPPLYPEELVEFPQILESLLSDETLPEKLAGTINKVLPNTEFSDSSTKATGESTTTTDPSSTKTMDECSVMDRRALEEVIEMASSDPAFDSLFSLFNVEREKFLEEEKKRLETHSASDSGKDFNRNGGGTVSTPSTCVSRQLFQLEVGEKQKDSSAQKSVESTNERQAESVNGMQAKNSTCRPEENSTGNQAQSSHGKVTHKVGMSEEAKRQVEEITPQKEKDSSDGDTHRFSEDEVVEMETETVSTSPVAQVEIVNADSSYIDVETTERDSPPPPEETKHQSEEEEVSVVTEFERPDSAKGGLSEKEIDDTDIEERKGDSPGKNAAQRLSSFAQGESRQEKGVVEGTLSGRNTVQSLLSGAPQEGSVQIKGDGEGSNADQNLSEAEVDVTDIEAPRGDFSGKNAAQRLLSFGQDASSQGRGVAEGTTSRVNRAQRLSSVVPQEEIVQSKRNSEGSNADQNLSEEEIDVTDIEEPKGDLSGKNAAERLASFGRDESTQGERVTEGNTSGVNGAQKLSVAPQKESKGDGEVSTAYQNQVAANKEQKNEEAPSTDTGKKVVRRRRRDRTNCSQGTRRSQRLEAKMKNSVSENTPSSNQEEDEETPALSPAESPVCLTESSGKNTAKIPNLEAANEYAKKILASMAHGTSNKSVTSDGDKRSVSHGNLYSQSLVSSRATPVGGKKCITMASLTNTTATVLSTRQNAEITTTTKSHVSKGKVTVMAPTGLASSLHKSHGVSSEDTSNMTTKATGGKSEKDINECAQQQGIAGPTMAANLQISSIGSVGMEDGSGAHARVQVTTKSTTSQETNVSVSSVPPATRLTDNSGNVSHGTRQISRPISTATSLQGASGTAYMLPPASSSMSNAYSIQSIQAHQQATTLVASNATNITGGQFVTATIEAPQNTQGLQRVVGVNAGAHLNGYQVVSVNGTQYIQPQQQAVNMAANMQNASSTQYVPVNTQYVENPPASQQAANRVEGGNTSREQYGPGSSTSYSIAGAQTSTLPLLVYNPTALQSTNVVPGLLQSNTVTPVNQSSMNVLYYPAGNNNTTLQLLQSSPGSSGILENTQIITLHQAADGLLSLAGAVPVSSNKIEQTTAVPQKYSRNKSKRTPSKKTSRKSKTVNLTEGHSNMDSSENPKPAAPLISPDSLPSAQHQPIPHGATVSQNQSGSEKNRVTQEVQEKSLGVEGSEEMPQRQPSNSNHLNLDNQGVATLINEELEQSLENASTQDIDFILKAITMTPQKEPVSSDCAKYSPLDKAIADKLKQFAVSEANQDSSTETQKCGQPSPLKKAAMHMQGEMVRSKTCVRQVFSDEDSFDKGPSKDARTESAERTANIENVAENVNRTMGPAEEKKDCIVKSSQIMNGFVPTSTLQTNYVRAHSNVLHTSLPDTLGSVTPSPESEKKQNRSECYEGSKSSESYHVGQKRSTQSAETQNGMVHSSQTVPVGLQESTTVPKCNNDKSYEIGKVVKPKHFKYKIDVEKRQKLEKRMRTRLKKENLEMKSGRGLEDKEARQTRIHERSDSRTSVKAGVTDDHGEVQVATEVINERRMKWKGGRDASEGRRVEKTGGPEAAMREKDGDNVVHEHCDSGDVRIDETSGVRVSTPGVEASEFEKRRDKEFKNISSDHRREITAHHMSSNDGEGDVPRVSERTSKVKDDDGDNLRSRIERNMDDRKWVEGNKEQNSEKDASKKVGEVQRRQIDLVEQKEFSSSRTEVYKGKAKRGTPDSKVRPIASGGRRVWVNERGQGTRNEERRKEVASEREDRENENIVRMREAEESKSVGVPQEKANSESLRGSNYTDGNMPVSGESPNLEKGMKDRRYDEQINDLQNGRMNICSTPKGMSEEAALSGQVGTEYPSSAGESLRGENLHHVVEKGLVDSRNSIDNLNQSEKKVCEQYIQNENMRQVKHFHAEPDVSPIPADEDDPCDTDIDSCSRTRVHYSKTNSKWGKPRAESTRISMSNEEKMIKPDCHSSQSLENGPNTVTTIGLNNLTHSSDNLVGESSRVIAHESNYPEADNRSSQGKSQASVGEGSSHALAGPSGVGVPGPKCRRENETKTFPKGTKRLCEDDTSSDQVNNRRKKKKSRNSDDFPTDFDLQKFLAKLKYN